MPATKARPARHLSTMKELAEQVGQHNEKGSVVVEIPSGQKLAFVQFSRIRHFTGHPFRVYTGERLADMVDSITRNGILAPLLVHRIYDDPDYDFEMLSGHNRMTAGILADLTGALCIVKENLSYAEAMMYVIETNLFQRSFKDLLPSEKAVVLTLRYSDMFSQGKRNDIRKELELLEGALETRTCGNGFHRSSRDALGSEYELTGRSIANYIRIGQHLSDGLKLRLDNGEFILRDGIQLSHLQPEEQDLLDSLLCEKGCRINKNKAAVLRNYSKNGMFLRENVLTVLSSNPKGRSVHEIPNRKSVKIGYQIYGQYFASTATRNEIEETISKALKFYFASRGEPA